MLAEGIYSGVPQRWGTAEPPGKSPYVWIELAVQFQWANNDWQPVQEVTRTARLYLSEKAWPHSKDKLVAMGHNGDFGPGMTLEPNPVELECRHDTYDGKTSEKWEVLLPGKKEVAGHIAATVDLIRKMNARYRSEVRQAPRKAHAAPSGSSAPKETDKTAAATGPATPGPEAPKGNDIPF